MSLQISNSTSDRRRARRIKRESLAQLMFWPTTRRCTPIDVQMLDYSSTGVGVLHDEAMLIGQKFILKEPFVTKGGTCLYAVARCDKRDDGRFTVGLHACREEQVIPDVEEKPVEPVRGWTAVAFIAATAIATAALLTMTFWN